MALPPSELTIEYDPVRIIGRIKRNDQKTDSPIWERLRAHFAGRSDVLTTPLAIEMPWPDILGVIREFGSRSTQQSLNFRFRPVNEAADKVAAFVRDLRTTREKRNSLIVELSAEEIEGRLKALGFTKRLLKPFQYRDIAHLLSLPHGANFSVPGAGKTTVTFALHLLVATESEHLLVVCPKAAFPAWRSIVDECMDESAPNGGANPFIILDGRDDETDRLLRSGAKRFVISYDLLVRQQSTIAAYLSRQPVHVVLDESHRMKAGMASQRGAFLLGVSSLPVRRDILSGTPMPQDANDLASQLGFLWPGQGLDLRLQRGAPPKEVLGQLYVRTTKQELGLPEATRHFYPVKMADGQLALYSVVRSEALRQLTRAVRSGGGPDYVKARKSVMRLLQLSSNPTLALQAMIADDAPVASGIVDKVIEEGPSTKMQAVADHARRLARAGKKSVIWTIFTGSILDFEVMLADLNPVSLYGGVPAGDPSDSNTREGRLLRFHLDGDCKVLIANPAAAGEGISLHTVCHDAIYLDRSYVSTHYLQSIDRIHRLGLPSDVETNIHIYQSRAPRELGSIDLSVSRRLATKIRNLQQLLEDPDLHRIALDEEDADDPVDLDVDLQDLVDLVGELEGCSPVEAEDE
ncbi:DEAD/DEAH box helicase [Pseudomonas aeruginosa]|uniref:SNF2-related protein n=1 Tax=Pseudomonas aeruginosa TaxID=287 RepID=UPI00040D2360|nr:DEAD/DEAH box helicase [Pseudomonas aeruginosa]MBG6450412.1 DEAD/DEAH box helicase [Pseudomonas aeruginosa]MBH3914059.1 DEAD/DEAH box helicase [Pseudomonas aeruginosa]MBH3926204.1 DEAD/DEAH box helicase [Pseudomonas aeruginosa]MBH9224870.1 DEAD/DEAH box helicase [Pseudomonas aeruginosa]MBU5932566.1 DEAD/DEAH box helicase [Pseudomonas aeruginosa]